MEIKKPNWKVLLKTNSEYRCNYCNCIIQQGQSHTPNGIDSNGNLCCLIIDM